MNRIPILAAATLAAALILPADPARAEVSIRFGTGGYQHGHGGPGPKGYYGSPKRGYGRGTRYDYPRYRYPWAPKRYGGEIPRYRHYWAPKPRYDHGVPFVRRGYPEYGHRQQAPGGYPGKGRR